MLASSTKPGICSLPIHGQAHAQSLPATGNLAALKNGSRWADIHGVMASGSFFVQTPEAALRHVKLLANGLKKVAYAGFAGGSGCGVIALLVGHYVVTGPQSSTLPGFRELSGIAFVAWFMTLALLVFAALYFLAGWGLSQQKPWARYAAAAVFLSKILLCVWLGRGSFLAMIIFLVVASWDIYGLWVLLAKETGQLLGSQKLSQAFDSPAPKARRA